MPQPRNRTVAPLHSFHIIENLVSDVRMLLESVSVAAGAPNIRDEMTDMLAKALVAVTRKVRAILHVIPARSEPHQDENRQLAESKQTIQENSRHRLNAAQEPLCRSDLPSCRK